MSEDRTVTTGTTQLPKELVDRLTRRATRFFRIEAAGGVVLLLLTVAALLISNSPWAHQFEQIWETPIGLQIGTWTFARSLQEWINDGLMTLFFFVVALELKRELVLGELNKPRVPALGRVEPKAGSDSSPATCRSEARRNEISEHVGKDGSWPKLPVHGACRKQPFTAIAVRPIAPPSGRRRESALAGPTVPVQADPRA